MKPPLNYQGTSDYVASEELQEVVKVALAIQRPLLLKGEPGTGKTLLAASIAEALKRPLLRWNIKSTTKAQDGLYLYDTVQRLNDSRFGDGNVADISAIKLGTGRGLHRREARRLAYRRDRQGRPGISKRPPRRDRRNAILHLRNEGGDSGERAPHGGHHLQFGEGTSGSFPAPLRLPLHRISR